MVTLGLEVNVAMLYSQHTRWMVYEAHGSKLNARNTFSKAEQGVA